MSRVDDARFWQAKLLAFSHDPAEKALVLMRTREGHEGGSVRALREAIFGAAGPDEELVAQVRCADWLASAADRVPTPKRPGERFPTWARVEFAERPKLVHPFTGRVVEPASLFDLDPKHLGELSFQEQVGLVERTEDGSVDFRRTFLRLWRLAPEKPVSDLGAFWRLLPADTRMPDHSIWEHLRLVSAFAGARVGDPEGQPALLLVTIGPVQAFIEQARSTSDLWAGSHLLSHLIGKGLLAVAERLGPDAVLFPDLHGVPVVDRWLLDQGLLSATEDLPKAWHSASDAHPLFAAALPNRFVALVPRAEGLSVVDAVRSAIRDEVGVLAGRVVDRLLREAGAGEADRDALVEEAMRQLASFPEIHHALVPWPVPEGCRGHDAEAVEAMLRPFLPEGRRHEFFASTRWRLLTQAIAEGDVTFFEPNAGVLYDPLFDLLERAAAAAKAERPRDALVHEGFRCSLCGEREWLSTNREERFLPPRRREEAGTLWTRLAERRPSWAKKGEHLCALCALKRLWPALFLDDFRELRRRHGLGDEGDAEGTRFVVSTHTMALTPTLEAIADRFEEGLSAAERKAFEELERRIEVEVRGEQVPLPRGLYRRVSQAGKRRARPFLKRLPALLDVLAENDPTGEGSDLEGVRRLVRALAGHAPERYLAFLLFDGDRMGRILSGRDEPTMPTLEERFHPDMRRRLKEQFTGNETLHAFLAERPPVSPARHAAVSRSLGDFALRTVPFVVEELFRGKLLYAGGDDVRALLPVSDALQAALALRCLYSGVWPDGVDGPATLGADEEAARRVRAAKGYVLLRGRLQRAMGPKASASCGLVVAHHQAPLGRVLRELRLAERRAKQAGGRNAFSVVLLKRSGAATHLTASFGGREPGSPGLAPLATSPAGALLALRDALAGPLTRQAAYHVLSWLPDLPRAPGEDMLVAAIGRQFARNRDPRHVGGLFQPFALAEQLVAAFGPDPERLHDAVVVAEFLAREGRVRGHAPVADEKAVTPEVER